MLRAKLLLKEEQLSLHAAAGTSRGRQLAKWKSKFENVKALGYCAGNMLYSRAPCNWYDNNVNNAYVPPPVRAFVSFPFIVLRFFVLWENNTRRPLDVRIYCGGDLFETRRPQNRYFINECANVDLKHETRDCRQLESTDAAILMDARESGVHSAEYLCDGTKDWGIYNWQSQVLYYLLFISTHSPVRELSSG